MSEYSNTNTCASGCGAQLIPGKFFTCGGCRTKSYCSGDCQKLHWKEHKTACKAAAADRVLCLLSAPETDGAAQYNLGVCYELGIGARKDVHEAARRFRIAASVGHSAAQAKLGSEFASIKPVVPEPEGIAKYFKSAQGGNAFAQYNLGVCYADGLLGVRKDSAEAIKWYTRSADGGQPEAMFNLAQALRKGEGVDAPDLEKATELYLRAASLGHVVARYNYAACLESGLGVPTDIPLALQHYQTAARVGHAGAAAAARRLTALLDSTAATSPAVGTSPTESAPPASQ